MHPLLIELEIEHRNLGRVLNYLRNQIDLIPQSRDDTLTNITLALEYMHQQPRISHHANEESLEKALADCGAQISDSLLSIRQDHDTFEVMTSQLLNTVRKHPNSRRLPDDLAGFIERYEQHMINEDKHLLPMSERVLDAKAWASLEDGWVAADDPVFGVVPSQRFLPLAQAVRPY